MSEQANPTASEWRYVHQLPKDHCPSARTLRGLIAKREFCGGSLTRLDAGPWMFCARLFSKWMEKRGGSPPIRKRRRAA